MLYNKIKKNNKIGSLINFRRKTWRSRFSTDFGCLQVICFQTVLFLCYTFHKRFFINHELGLLYFYVYFKHIHTHMVIILCQNFMKRQSGSIHFMQSSSSSSSSSPPSRLLLRNSILQLFILTDLHVRMFICYLKKYIYWKFLKFEIWKFLSIILYLEFRQGTRLGSTWTFRLTSWSRLYQLIYYYLGLCRGSAKKFGISHKMIQRCAIRHR